MSKRARAWRRIERAIGLKGALPTAHSVQTPQSLLCGACILALSFGTAPAGSGFERASKPADRKAGYGNHGEEQSAHGAPGDHHDGAGRSPGDRQGHDGPNEGRRRQPADLRHRKRRGPVHVERESANGLALSITSGKRLVELCTFSASATKDDASKETTLRIGGLETYKTSQSRIAGFIPAGPKSIPGFSLYKRFLEQIGQELRSQDAEARVVIDVPEGA